MLHVRLHLFHEFLFVYLFSLSDTGIIMMLLQYYVCCITHYFQLWRQTFGTPLNNANWCIHWPVWHSRLKKHICVEGRHF